MEEGVVRKQENKTRLCVSITGESTNFDSNKLPSVYLGVLKSESFVRKAITKCNWYSASLKISK